MGSPISTAVPDFVMKSIESGILASLLYKMKFFYRYVDDILACVPEDKIEELQLIFNKYSPGLNFTMEREKDESISFLDNTVKENDGRLEMD